MRSLQRIRGGVRKIPKESIPTEELFEASPLLKLQRFQEDNMTRLHKVLQHMKLKEGASSDGGREKRAKSWVKQQELSQEIQSVSEGLKAIHKVREEREELELIWAIDKEIGELDL